ncbi:radical SAM protein [candidate division KSB3 bacterium]|nr:radical SAM protein [candidate division KSB3 bacterium]
MRILLVEPDFPYPSKSKNQANKIHKNFVPVGLLKLGAYHNKLGHKVKLVRGNVSIRELGSFKPSMIFVTSIFTYWSKYVWDTIEHYRTLFPEAKIIIGGIYATLHSDRKYFREKLSYYNAKCHVGLHSEAEEYYPDYTLLNGQIDHHVTHAMRGCIRKCSFCGVWKIEPKRTYKTSEDLIEEIKEVGKNKVIFFDNNFLANENIKEILSDLSKLRVNNRPVRFECQSGFDGRLLEGNPELATLLKKANFHSVRIAWDNSLRDFQSVKKQLDYLGTAGYKPKDIFVFMVYNYEIPYEKMLKKLEYCKKWGVQIADCRYRPLDSLKDDYNPGKYRTGQTDEDYYIHTKSGWTDHKIRDFRKRVRQHNIWVRYAKDKGLEYDKRMEKWSGIHTTFKYFHMGRPPQLEIMEKSPTWKRRLEMMNRVKNYYRKHSLNSLNFSSFSKSRIDDTLSGILDEIEGTKTTAPG